MKNLNILVTGAGSGVGQSIIKALILSKFPCTIFPADIDHFNSFLYLSKKSVIVPKVENPKTALRWYLTQLRKLKIHVIMIGSEFDLEFFSKYKSIIEKKTNCKVCITKPSVLNISNDKYFTQEFLKKNKLPYLKTFLPKDMISAVKIFKSIKGPIILKPRKGTSSRNVFLIKNIKALKKKYKLVKNPIIQEQIPFKKEILKDEYTCSFFSAKEKKVIGPIILRRKLLNGTSWITEVIKNKRIEKIVLNIAKKIDNEGPFNIQLAIGNRGPIPFEFNSRFSGTTSIRAYFGFNEPLMFLKNYVLKKKIKNPLIKKGISFRYINEIFLDDVNKNQINNKFGKGKILNLFK